MTKIKKERSNREKLSLAEREPNNLFKAKSISITEKANLFYQITNGDEANLYGCQQKNSNKKNNNNKKKKKKKSVPRDQKDKGVLVSNNAEQMDVDVPMPAHLQDEIRMDILSRLPVRSLCQFKCVSKFWKTFISDSYFKMMHLNRAKNDHNSQKLLIARCCPEDDKFTMYCLNLSADQPVENVRQLDFPLIYKPYRCIIACCYDGLAIVIVNDNIDGERHIYLLWNPSTGESVVLPDPQFLDNSGVCMGLGYDSTAGDYKILAINRKDYPGEILKLKSGSWRYIDKHPRGIWSYNEVMHHLPFVNGAFHWIGLLGHFLSPSRSYSVVSFSISNEVYGEIPLPEQLLCFRNFFSVGVSVLGGMLCVYSNSRPRGTYKFWVLKDYGVKEYWTSLLTIEDPHIIYAAIPKYMFADGELLYWSLISGGTFGSAFRTRNGPFGLWPQCDTIQGGLAFTESLISPKSLI